MSRRKHRQPCKYTVVADTRDGRQWHSGCEPTRAQVDSALRELKDVREVHRIDVWTTQPVKEKQRVGSRLVDVVGARSVRVRSCVRKSNGRFSCRKRRLRRVR